LSSWKSLRKMEMDPLWLMRIFTIIPVVLILVAGAGALWMYFFVSSLLPESQTRVDLPGLAADVRVVRDRHGVPGIIGEKEEDLAMVLGYVMAQDRLWQMDFLRRAAQGRLAEIFGSAHIEADHLMRTVGAGADADVYPGRLGEPDRKWLEEFVKGINRYISSHSGKLPVEFSFLEYRPDPFSPKDIMAIFSAMAWESSLASRVDPVMTSLLCRLGNKRARLLFPTDPAVSSGYAPSGLKGWVPGGTLFSRPADPPNRLRIPGLRGGAAWAVGGLRSRSGRPLACWNIYQTLTAPRFWYRARLVAGDFHLSGAFIPGTPVAFVGSNERISWGSVSSPVDDADLFLESVDSDAPRRYWRVDRWHKVRVRKEKYRVRGASSVARTILLTETGPLVSNAANGKALSLKWTGADGSGLYRSLYALNRSRNGGEVRKSLAKLVAPCLSVVWADDKDNYGVQPAGRIPIRCPGDDGIAPMPAWTAVHDWQGFIPFDELPAVTNPAEGAVIVTGGRPGGMGYPFFVGCYWNDDSAHGRIKELLEDESEHQKESFRRMQLDTVSLSARRLTPIILKAIETGARWGETEQESISLLNSWDFEMGRKSIGAAIFGLIYQSLVDELFRREMGDDLYDRFTAYSPLTSRMVTKIFVDRRHEWLGSVKPHEILRKCFQRAMDRGKVLMGDDPKEWDWGAIHKTVFRHPLTEKSRFLELLYQVGPVPTPGSIDTIDFAGWSNAHPFSVSEGVSLRQIADMTAPPRVFGVSPMGSSAHFFSTHYKDQMSDWLNGRSFRDPIQRADIRKHGFNAVLFKARRPGKLSGR